MSAFARKNERFFRSRMGAVDITLALAGGSTITTTAMPETSTTDFEGNNRGGERDVIVLRCTLNVVDVTAKGGRGPKNGDVITWTDGEDYIIDRIIADELGARVEAYRQDELNALADGGDREVVG